ncbi:hypothetical protein OC846_000235 [Tilletia horrida]|uniref:PAS domain-containing protein n=1 Tax=Tilletia horrida TaxID=155126 RepID=A0AAN6GW43_9BASI|nr:hypothetical protein OC846_000235 [Tilletia horrida]KAK0570358.1 hypothetical protein OC861_000101 [Tilletia horrida]
MSQDSLRSQPFPVSASSSSPILIPTVPQSSCVAQHYPHPLSPSTPILNSLAGGHFTPALPPTPSSSSSRSPISVGHQNLPSLQSAHQQQPPLFSSSKGHILPRVPLFHESSVASIPPVHSTPVLRTDHVDWNQHRSSPFYEPQGYVGGYCSSDTSPLSPSATLVERSLSTQSGRTQGGIKLDRSYSASSTSALLAQLRHIELDRSHPTSPTEVFFEEAPSPAEHTAAELVGHISKKRKTVPLNPTQLPGIMTPTFDFNAFINSTSPPSSPLSAAHMQTSTSTGMLPSAGVGAGGLDIHGSPLKAAMRAATGGDSAIHDGEGLPVFDPGQPPGGGGGHGNKDNMLPSWATASEYDPSRLSSFSISAKSGGISMSGNQSISQSPTAQHQFQQMPSQSNVRSGSMDAMLFSTSSQNNDKINDTVNMQSSNSGHNTNNNVTGPSGLYGLDGIGGLGMGMDGSIDMMGLGLGAMGNQQMMDIGNMSNAGLAAVLNSGNHPPLGPDAIRRHTTDITSVGGGGSQGPVWNDSQIMQQAQQMQMQWGLQQQIRIANQAAVGRMLPPSSQAQQQQSLAFDTSPRTAPLPHQQQMLPQQQQMVHPPAHLNTQHQGAQAPFGSGSYPQPGNIPTFYSSGAIMTSQGISAAPTDQQQPTGHQASAQSAVEKAQEDYRARIAAHHNQFLKTANAAETVAAATQDKTEEDDVETDESAPLPKDASDKQKTSPSKSKDNSKSASPSAPSGTTASGNKSGNSAKVDIRAARESVAARVMSWAAETGGPEAGSGASSESSSNSQSASGRGRSSKAGPEGGPKAAHAQRLSLQERRRLSRLVASEGTGSDSGGSGDTQSQRHSHMEPNGGSGFAKMAGGLKRKSISDGGPGDDSPATAGHERVVSGRTKRAMAAGQAAAEAAAEQDSHSSNYNGSKSKSASSGDDDDARKSTASSARAVRESSGEGVSTDSDPVFHGPYHEIAVTANAKGGPNHVRNSYSSSGFDILGALTKVATRKNPRIQLGPIDLSCAFTVSDALSPDHPLIYVSDTFTRLTGYSPADVLGRNCRFLQAPDGNVTQGSERLNTDGRAVAHIKKHIDRTRECQASLINYKKNGKAFINLVTIVPIPWGDSNVIQYFVGFQVDLVEQPGAILEKDANGQYVVNYTTSARKPMAPPVVQPTDPIREALEEKHRQVNGAHKLAEIVANGQTDVRPWARLLLDNSHDLVHVLSLKGIFLYVSPSVERILGYKAEELIGRSISDFCHPSDVVPVFRELKDSTSNASIAAAARRSAKAAGGYKALTKGGAGQSGPQVNLLLRMRHKHLGHQWIESIGKLHLEQGKGRKVVISSGRARTVYNLSWDQVRQTASDREPAFWSKVSVDGLLLSSTSRTAAVLGCTPIALQGQHLAEMSNSEAVPAILEALRSGSVSMVSHMLRDTTGNGEPVPVLSTFFPSAEHALAMKKAEDFGQASDDLPAEDPDANSQLSSKRELRDSTSSVFVHIRRATGQISFEANISYMNDLQMLKVRAQLQPGSMQVLPPHASVLKGADSKPLGSSKDAVGEAEAAAAAAAALDIGGAGSVFTELSTYRSSSWVFELHQLKIMNKKLREEVKTLQRRSRMPNNGASQSAMNGATPVAGNAGETPSNSFGNGSNNGLNQQMLAHHQQMAAQASAISHHPNHVNSIIGSLNGNGSFGSGFAMSMEHSSSQSSMGGPSVQSPTASRVLPSNGGMSGRANALAAAGIRRPDIVPMQQQHNSAFHNGGHPLHSSFQQRLQSMNMSMDSVHSIPMMGMGSGGAPMDPSSSSGAGGTMSSASIFDTYPQQHQHRGGHQHRFLIPHGGNGSSQSSANASGETSTTATSLESNSNQAIGSNESGSGSSTHRNGSSSAEEAMKDQKRRIDASSAVLSKAAAVAAAQQQQQRLQSQAFAVGEAIAGRKRSAAGELLPVPDKTSH